MRPLALLNVIVIVLCSTVSALPAKQRKLGELARDGSLEKQVSSMKGWMADEFGPGRSLTVSISLASFCVAAFRSAPGVLTSRSLAWLLGYTIGQEVPKCDRDSEEGKGELSTGVEGTAMARRLKAAVAKHERQGPAGYTQPFDRAGRLGSLSKVIERETLPQPGSSLVFFHFCPPLPAVR